MGTRISQIESERGKPLKEVLKEEFVQQGTLAGLARAMGVSQATLNRWLLKYRLSVKTELVEWERGA